jgi:hypothetical protein
MSDNNTRGTKRSVLANVLLAPDGSRYVARQQVEGPDRWRDRQHLETVAD